MVENCLEKRCDCLNHCGDGRAVVGLEQRIEKSFKVLRVDRLDTIRVIGAEVPIHGARKKHREFAENFRIVVKMDICETE